jgi:ABC-type branched-subunit amino acid transport system permease subunit
MYLDTIVMIMASITFISRLTACSSMFNEVADFFNLIMSKGGLFIIIFTSIYNTFAVAVFTSFLFAFFQFRISSVFYSLARTFLLFINGFFFQSKKVFLSNEDFNKVIELRSMFLCLINVIIVRLIATFMVFNTIVTEHLALSSISRKFGKDLAKIKEDENRKAAEAFFHMQESHKHKR